MSVHRRMPVVATAESGREFPRWRYIRIAIQDMTNLVRVFLVDAGEGSFANRSAAAASNVGAVVFSAARGNRGNKISAVVKNLMLRNVTNLHAIDLITLTS